MKYGKKDDLSLIKLYFSEKAKIYKKLDYRKILNLVNQIYKTYKKDGTIFIMGNGGSSGIAEGFSVDIRTHPFVSEDKSKTTLTRRPRVICLTESSGALTGISNDIGFSFVFSEQLKNFMRSKIINKNDLLIAFSSSGNSQNMIYDRNGIFVGWEPFQQFDLSAEMDSLHCVYENSYDCEPELSRGHSISGQDPYFPWFNLGNDTGLDIIRLAEPYVVNGDTFRYMFEDEDVINGIEYTYAVVSYDMGVEPYYSVRYIDLGNGQYQTEIDTNFSNPNKWADPDGYASIENSKGTTILDRNFVQVYPGVSPTIDLKNVTVVPNPYIGGSKFNESEHSRKIRFTNLTKNCTIKIFTVAGELVTILRHSDESSGNAFWDMRTMNNQEAGPGLYIYHVQTGNNDNDSFIGKFAVVR